MNDPRILVVDDDDSLRRVLQVQLEQIGYSVSVAPNGAEALSMLRQTAFDLVLTDEAMPDLVGIELAGEIRRIRPDVPIVLMSGHGGVRLANRAADIGVNEVLHKPLQRGDLAESIARHLRSID